MREYDITARVTFRGSIQEDQPGPCDCVLCRFMSGFTETGRNSKDFANVGERIIRSVLSVNVFMQDVREGLFQGQMLFGDRLLENSMILLWGCVIGDAVGWY